MQVNNTAYIHSKWKRFGYLFLWVYAAILVHLTLFTHNYYTYGRSANFQLFKSIQLMLDSGSFALMFDNVIGNILLFMPLGFLLPLLLKKPRNLFIMFLIGCCTSFIIEFSQYEWAQRIFDIDDIFLNVVGTLAGWLGITVIRAIFGKLKG